MTTHTRLISYSCKKLTSRSVRLRRCVYHLADPKIPSRSRFLADLCATYCDFSWKSQTRYKPEGNGARQQSRGWGTIVQDRRRRRRRRCARSMTSVAWRDQSESQVAIIATIVGMLARSPSRRLIPLPRNSLSPRDSFAVQFTRAPRAIYLQPRRLPIVNCPVEMCRARPRFSLDDREKKRSTWAKIHFE